MKDLEYKSQTQKVTQCLVGEERGDGELVFNGNRVSDWENEKVLEMDSGNGCMAI